MQFLLSYPQEPWVHAVDPSGVRPDPNKIKAVTEFPTLHNIKDVRSSLGLCSYFPRFIKLFSDITEPLNKLLSKDGSFVWEMPQTVSFQALKTTLKKVPVLAHFSDTVPTHIHADASSHSVGMGVHKGVKEGQMLPPGIRRESKLFFNI